MPPLKTDAYIILSSLEESVLKVENAALAQLVELLICNQSVVGSSPIGGSIFKKGEIPEWPNGADCKSVAKAS